MKTWYNKYKSVMWAAFIICAIGVAYGYNEYNRGLPDLNCVKSAFNLKASELITQFETDEQKATSQYSDKPISVRGVIGSVKATDTSATVFLNETSSMTSVICQFGKQDKEQIKTWRKGDSVTVKGVCSGFLMDVVMVRCVADK